MKDSIKHLLYESTIHGVSKIVGSKRFIFSLMWFVCMLLSSSICVVFVLKIIFEYLNFETISKFDTILERNSIFPVVAICNLFDRNFTISVLSIHFNYKSLNKKTRFQSYYDSAYGRCYKFNSGFDANNNYSKLLESTSSGRFFGLILEIYVEPTNSDYNQLIVHIYNQTQSHLSMFNKGYLISSGSYNHFEIKRIYDQKLPLPYNDCYKDYSLFPHNKTLIKFILNNNITYTQNECIRLCQNLIYIESGQDSKCGCYLNNLDENIFVKCKFTQSNKTISDCFSKFAINFEKIDPSAKCSNYCPLECESFSYEISNYVETISLTGNITKQKFMFNDSRLKTYEDISRKYFGLYVYYDELKYTLISQKPKLEIFDLFSNVGGLFGLFLGMGLMSFIEIIEIILEIIIQVFQTKLRQIPTIN